MVGGHLVLVRTRSMQNKAQFEEQRWLQRKHIVCLGSHLTFNGGDFDPMFVYALPFEHHSHKLVMSSILVRFNQPLDVLICIVVVEESSGTF